MKGSSRNDFTIKKRRSWKELVRGVGLRLKSDTNNWERNDENIMTRWRGATES